MERKFHITPNGPQLCVAAVRDCKYAQSGPHFSSSEEAQSHFEQNLERRSDVMKPISKKSVVQADGVIKSNDNSTPVDPTTAQESSFMKKPDMITNYLHTSPLKEMNTVELSHLVMDAAKEHKMDTQTVHEAITLASILHGNQIRGMRGKMKNLPYIEHPLRNAARLIRMGVKDQNVIVATVLHDTVEDGSMEFVKRFHDSNVKSEPEAREVLRKHIDQRYGKDVLDLVDGVTNDYVPTRQSQQMSPEQKRKVYFDHVSEVIQKDSRVALVKVTDFIDNAASLRHQNTPDRKEKTKKQAAKYLPVVPVFQKVFASDEMKNHMSDEGIKEVQKHLKTIRSSLKQIVNN